MSLYVPINGWSKRTIKDHISREFRGKATDEGGHCFYLMPDGRKCAVGLFIPSGHEGQKTRDSVSGLLEEYPDLESSMPLSVRALSELQEEHDDLSYSSVTNQLNHLLEWVDTYVADALPQQDVGNL